MLSSWAWSVAAAGLLASVATVARSADAPAPAPQPMDWLMDPTPYRAQVMAEGKDLILDNGIARRVIRNGTTVDLVNLSSGEHLLRALSPEARVTIDGTEYPVGGLAGQKIMNYYKAEWIDTLPPMPGSYQFADWKEAPVVERFAWKKRPEWLAKDVAWPPPGKHVVIRFTPPTVPHGAEPPGANQPPAALPEVAIHYELYDGIPVFSKWLEVKNQGTAAVRVNTFIADELRLVEAEGRGGDCHGPGSERERPNIHVETDMAFGGRMYAQADNHAVKLDGDPLYHTHVNYMYPPPTLLTVAPRGFRKGDGNLDPSGQDDTIIGPDQDVPPGDSFTSFRTFELLLDSTERERRSLAQRRMYRVIAPWTNENPLMFHKIHSDPETIRAAIDQASAVGFEMVIMSFGSGFNFESRDRAYWDTYKQLADYGRSKGVVLGGYSLLASRGAGDGTNTKGPAMFGVMPCLGATWGRDYLDTIVAFSKYAGLGAFENDGSYPGDHCAATDHPHHRGFEDSQWVNWKAITGQYQALKAEGVFLNIPDWYFLAGANKCAMGYRETNWSLPRAEQEIIERQNMFDGTWGKTQTMGWMFVPLSQYHGGGAAATIEPLHEHLLHYEARLANLLGYGVQACYRGPQLFDTPETKALVQKWVTFYKDHREVLDFGDIIHLRRASGLDWDGILHVNPQGHEKAMAFFYNPLPEAITRDIRVPLHYAGLAETASVSVGGAPAQVMTLDRTESLTLRISIPAGGHQWVLFTAGR